LLAENLRAAGFEIDAEDFPAGIGLAWEEIRAITHAGTHVDAPWHYGPRSGGGRSKTIEEIPLEWCFGEACVLDFRAFDPGTEIDADDIEKRLDALDHDLSPGEIVLIETGADELWGSPEYLTDFPGMSSEATEYLLEAGVRVIGTDAYGFDKPFAEMGRRFAETGSSEELWPAHVAGREREYCQIEKLANLDRLPRRTGVPLVAFPVRIENASAGWVRPVAFAEPE
jgi:kynurenine formamidase